MNEASLRKVARTLYPAGDLVSRSQRLRPSICPFEPLVAAVPEGAHVLDIGCGAGLLLGLLASTGRIDRGVGFDANAAAVASARDMAFRAGLDGVISFHHVKVDEPWPSGSFDTVTMIDVMHHIPKDARFSVLDGIANTLSDGGTFVYKDMDARPWWRGLGNRVHDLVLAGDWIRYEPVNRVLEAAQERSLEPIEQSSWARYWYGHHLALFAARGPGLR